MTLKERLDELKAKSQANPRISPEARAIMQRSIEDLRKSGIVNRVVRAGDRAPDFTLPDSAGKLVSLGELLARGPAVLSFFRGRW
jgi:AhpC/TSA family